MKKMFLILFLAILLNTSLCFAVEADVKIEKMPVTKAVKNNVQAKKVISKRKAHYSCIIHPSVRVDKPGQCPQCGMKLMKRYDRVSGVLKNKK